MFWLRLVELVVVVITALWFWYQTYVAPAVGSDEKVIPDMRKELNVVWAIAFNKVGIAIGSWTTTSRSFKPSPTTSTTSIKTEIGGISPSVGRVPSPNGGRPSKRRPTRCGFSSSQWPQVPWVSQSHL